MGKKVIQGNLQVIGSVEASPIESTRIHIKEGPKANPSGIARSASVDQTASNITFNSSTSTLVHSSSGSTSLTYNGIEMTRTEKLKESGEETTDTYNIQFPLESGTLALTSDFEYATTAEIEALFNS